MKKKLSAKAKLNQKYKEYKEFLKDDRDWDFTHILRLLRYKLGRTRKEIVGNKIVADSKEIGQQIKEVEILLKRVIENNYEKEIFKDFHKKYGQLKWKFIKEKGESYTRVTTYYTKETPENLKQLKKERMALNKKCLDQKHADLKKAFDLMHKNIWGWWD